MAEGKIIFRMTTQFDDKEEVGGEGEGDPSEIEGATRGLPQNKERGTRRRASERAAKRVAEFSQR